MNMLADLIMLVSKVQGATYPNFSVSTHSSDLMGLMLFVAQFESTWRFP